MSETQDKVEQYFSKHKLRRYTKGQIFIFADDMPEYLYYLKSGVVKQYVISYRGDEVIVNLFKPPAFFPMLPVMTGIPNKYFFEADTAVELYQAPVQETVDFFKANPDVVYDLLTRVYRGLDGVLGRVVHLMTSTAKDRLIYELITQARRFGREEAGKLTIQLSEKDLGARAGLSRETVNREMSKLKATKLVTVTRSSIVINDMVALEKQIAKT